MSEELSRIWGWRYKALHADVAGLKAEMQWVRLRLAPDTTSQTQSSQTSSSAPTGSPPKPWLQRIAGSAFEKLGREAISATLMWVGGKLLTWLAYLVLGLPALAWLAKYLRLFGLG